MPKWTLAKLLPEIDRLPPHWALIPIGSNKQPQHNNWTDSRYSSADFRSAASQGRFSNAWVTPKGKPSYELPEGACRAVGALCGEPSKGLLFFDHDGVSCDRLIQEVSGVSLKEALPKTPLVRSGRPGRYQLIYQVPERFWAGICTKKLKTGVKGDDGKPEQIEFRWTGTQSVILGHHPMTGGYEWIYHPEDVPVAEAPMWMLEQMLDTEPESEVTQLEIKDRNSGDSGAARVSPHKSWAKFDNDFMLPCAEVVPIEVAIAPSTRKILDGNLDKGRNDSGIQLASDLIGTANYLDSIGQRYSGNIEQLFFSWCSQQGLDKDQPKGQPNAIWKSAQKGKRPSLTPEQIEGCIKGYIWKQQAGERVATEKAGESQGTADVGEEVATITPELLRGEITKLGTEKDPFTAALLRGTIQRKFSISAKEIEFLQSVAVADSSPIEPMGNLIETQFFEMLDQVGSLDAVGCQTQFPAINQLVSGFKRKDLSLIAGRPAMGKSVLALQMAYHFAVTYGRPIIFFSLEMDKLQVLSRLVSSLASIPAGKMGVVQLNEAEEARAFQVLTHLKEVPLFLDDTPRLTPEMLKKRAIEVAKGEQIGAIFLDYLQLLTPDRFFPNSTEKVSFFSRELKVLSGELNCPVIALSQLNRSLEARQDKRPTVADLRESGALEQDASAILLMYRDEYYNPGTPDRGIAEINVGKNRHGPTGIAKLLFEGQFVRFHNM